MSDALLIACSYPDPAPPDVVDVQDFCAQTGLSEDIVLEEFVPRSVLLYTMLPRLFKYSFLIDLNDSAWSHCCTLGTVLIAQEQFPEIL